MVTQLMAFVMSVITIITTLFPFLQPYYDVYNNVRYGENERNVMDIYVPKDAEEKDYNGCILFIHGGSWTGGDKNDIAIDCMNFARDGYITATMNYTLYSEENADTFTVDMMLDDINNAIKGIKAFSDEKGLNITKIATSGYSSGAHISMLYCYSRGDDSVIDLAFTANRVGPADFSYEVWGNTGYNLAYMLSGTPITPEMIADGSAQAVIDSVSPSAYVTSEAIPSLFAYGGKDDVVSIANGESMKKAFDKAGATYDFFVFPNSGHGLLLDPIPTIKFFAKFREYCEVYFGY